MHRFVFSALALSLSLVASIAQAQNGAGYSPRRSQTFGGSVAQPLSSPSQSSTAAIVAEFLARQGIFVPADSIVVDGAPVNAANSIRVYRLSQRVAGLQVYGVSAKAAFSPTGALVFLTQNFVTDLPSALNGAAIGESQALGAALGRLYPNERIAVGAARREQNAVVFERTPFFHDSPRVTHVAVPMTDGALTRGLLVETWSENANQLHETLVGAGRGDILDVVSRTASDSYNVFTEDPGKSAGVQAIVVGPGAGNTQSPTGWLSGTQKTINIGGNNVRSYLDVDSNNRIDNGGTTVTGGNFDATADLNAEPSTTGNRAVAVQNLFYFNNVMHDELYKHGFTEAAGNFQENNFGKGGAGADSVLAEAQDGGGLDNANFSTPTDGRKPRMQMYLWNPLGLYQVRVNNPISALYQAAASSFGPAPTETGITGAAALASPAEACTAVSGVSGKIAIVDRGTCNFTDKVKNAQAAGATAVIIVNNVDGAIFSPGATGSTKTIKISSVMISKADGKALKGLASPNVTVQKANPAPPKLDGSVDADIVFHEYGHGLTWRMIGGMSGPLAGAIGEGASDVNAFLQNGDDRIGEYSSSDPAGIRRYPYAGYPLTYGDVTGAEVHADGEVYAAAMWHLKELFDGAGLATSTLQDYFVDGMNFTPSTPAFEDMRNGMLQAASPNAGHCDLIWQAFSQFGIGLNANGIAGSTSVSITEDFNPGNGCTIP